MDEASLRTRIEAAFDDRKLLEDKATVQAVLDAIDALDRGEARVASPPADGEGPWTTHAWLKKAILLYFAVRKMETMEIGPFEFHDKIPLKKNLAAQKVRVVPPGVARYGSFLEPNVIVMPGYVNIGARVGEGTMVDTWATVGSCAQIGSVLEPPGATPVIVEDGAFIGSRVILVEGMHIGKEAVIGAGVVLTSSTTIIDVTGETPVERKGSVPARSVVIPGTRMKRFPAGEFGVPCALIIGRRSASTDRKVSLNDALRDFNVSV